MSSLIIEYHQVPVLRKKQHSPHNSEADIGGTFQYRGYENAELVSSKQLTAFSDHRFPLDSPDHVSLPQYVDYLRSYVDHFALAPFIKLRSRVVNISLLKPSISKWKHRVQYTDNASGEQRNYDCSHVAICTGLHVEPNIPSIKGIENVNRDVFHSSKYKARSQLTGRNVLILGCGETAMGGLSLGL
jgi:dimethylaniline monooxygenase (N-oxide forming)